MGDWGHLGNDRGGREEEIDEDDIFVEEDNVKEKTTLCTKNIFYKK